MDDVVKYNREAWDGLVEKKNQWTVPIDTEKIAAARQGQWEIVLTPTRAVPREWFGELDGKDVLCLAGAGGQQAPILAAAGARVTVFDNSPKQLEQDQLVAKREGLVIQTVLGDMRNLEVFSDRQFDLVFHPCSNGFVPDVKPVWRESYRVLNNNGRLLSGFVNPVYYLFDYWRMEKGELHVCNKIPYSDLDNLDAQQRQRLVESGEPFEFGHSLQDQIGGQLEAGFLITDFYEDNWPEGATSRLSEFIDVFIATCALKQEQIGWFG